MEIPVIQQRAYSDEQKLQRREAILCAAADLFKSRRYEKVTMIDIADQTGLAKGTLYVYFRTKEELFLAYAKQEIDLFFSRLHNNLCAYRESAGVRGVTKALGAAFSESKELVRLLSLLHTVLESNTGYEKALAFRRALLPLLEETGVECERHLTFLKPGMGKKLLLTIHGISLGIQQLAYPSPIIHRVEQQPGMELYTFDFETSLLTIIDLLLAGMEVRANE